MPHKNVVRLASNGFEMYHKSAKKPKTFQETGLFLMLVWYFRQPNYEKKTDHESWNFNVWMTKYKPLQEAHNFWKKYVCYKMEIENCVQVEVCMTN